MTTWPSLSTGPFEVGMYFVAYKKPGSFHPPEVDEENPTHFASLESALFSESGALATLSGTCEVHTKHGPPTHVVLYTENDESERVALAVESSLDGGKTFDVALFDRTTLPPPSFSGADLKRPGLIIENLWDEAVETAPLSTEDPSSYPGA